MGVGPTEGVSLWKSQRESLYATEVGGRGDISLTQRNRLGKLERSQAWATGLVNDLKVLIYREMGPRLFKKGTGKLGVK